MHIASIEEYGIRCVLRLAQGYPNSTLSAAEIAQMEGLSVEYVSKILHLLKKSELVGAKRGSKGGFLLLDAPESIKLRQVIEALGGAKKQNRMMDLCDKFKGNSGECVHQGACSLAPIWEAMFENVNHYFESLSFGDLLEGHVHVKGKITLIQQAFKGANSLEAQNLNKKEELNHVAN